MQTSSSSSSIRPPKQPGRTSRTSNCSTVAKLYANFDLKHFVYFHCIVSVAIYLIMIEGLGKGVKYSLFVANAIIFVSEPHTCRL